MSVFEDVTSILGGKNVDFLGCLLSIRIKSGKVQKQIKRSRKPYAFLPEETEKDERQAPKFNN